MKNTEKNKSNSLRRRAEESLLKSPPPIKKISISKSNDGEMKVAAEYRKLDLPNPGSEIGEKVIEAFRRITYLEGDTGKTPLAIGVRDGSIEINVKLKKEENGESVTLKFPE